MKFTRWYIALADLSWVPTWEKGLRLGCVNSPWGNQKARSHALVTLLSHVFLYIWIHLATLQGIVLCGLSSPRAKRIFKFDSNPQSTRIEVTSFFMNVSFRMLFAALHWLSLKVSLSYTWNFISYLLNHLIRVSTYSSCSTWYEWIAHMHDLL